MSATPRPWQTTRELEGWTVCSHDDENNCDEVGFILDQEDAEHIVRCVNSFEPLVEALRQARQHIEALHNDLDGAPDCPHLKTIDDALRLAGALGTTDLIADEDARMSRAANDAQGWDDSYNGAHE